MVPAPRPCKWFRTSAPQQGGTVRLKLLPEGKALCFNAAGETAGKE
jgi:hypothetical protein